MRKSKRKRQSQSQNDMRPIMCEELYKLTDEHGFTYGGTKWGKNVTHSGTGRGDLCGPGFIHAYTDQVLAVMMNPAHACFKTPRLYLAEGIVALNDGCKVGCVSLTTLKRLPLPRVTLAQRVRFGILSALEVCADASFVEWANNWLSGKDRSVDVARLAANVANAASAARLAAADAANAANAANAADAARLAADAANAARRATTPNAINLAKISRLAVSTK